MPTESQCVSESKNSKSPTTLSARPRYYIVNRLREGRNILQDIRSGEEQYFTGPNQNLPDRKV